MLELIKSTLFIFLFTLGVLAAAERNSSVPDFSQVPGVVVAHSPKSTSLFFGSPGIAVLPDGSYLAKCDEFGEATKKKPSVTRLYRSTDRGKTWVGHHTVEGLFWPSIFVHRNSVYLMGTTKTNGLAVILKSDDGGSNWTSPVDKDHGLLFDDGRYHCAPGPVVIHDGRIWRAMEDAMGQPRKWGAHFQAFMMSAPVNADLLKASSWTSSNRLARNEDWLDGHFGGWLEGNAVVAPKGEIINILRVDYRVSGGKAALIQVSPDGRTARFDPQRNFINFPGGCKKFTIRFDAETGLYWSLTNWIAPINAGGNPAHTRNTIALIASSDLRHWDIRCVLLHHSDTETHGFQYLDWQFDGDDLIALSRTAYEDGLGGAESQHNANLITFHRFADFRKLGPADSVVPPHEIRWKEHL